MDIIRTVAELDRKIEECNAAEAISDDAMRAVFDTFCMEMDETPHADPFSPDYRRQQMDLYGRIVGAPYSTEHEATVFDVETALVRPFPFSTASATTAGDYFMSIGHLLRTMALPPGSRVLEFGAGWGFTSLWLAQLGHHVTVVDIEARFCELIRRRGERENVAIETINTDFFWAETCRRTFDAVVFFGCFHHCDDHMRLLRALKGAVAPGGRIFFADEPITPDFPTPWGLRMDGCSVWAIRKNGWLELGFRDDYFRAALVRAGWIGRKVQVSGADRLRIWEARHIEEATMTFDAAGPQLRTQSGQRTASGIVVARGVGGCAMFGPYIDLSSGTYAARLKFAPERPASGDARIDIVCDGGTRQIAELNIDPRGAATVELRFALDLDASGVEARLFPGAKFEAVVRSLEIEPV